MAWTYGSSPSTSDRDAVRYLIGDTVAGSTSVRWPTLSDSEIAYELANAGSVTAAASNAARALAARYATEPQDKKVGDLSLSYGDRHAQLLTIASELSDDATLAALPIAGGISVTDKTTVEDDTDRVQPAFVKGMMDHPDVAWPDTTSTGARGY